MAEASQGRKYRIVHYLNQFFGGVGGEEKADCEPFTVQGLAGPGRLLEELFREENADVEIVATVGCGARYFADHQETVLRELIPLIRGYHPDLVVAGPAFNAGRYGMACGAICSSLEPLGIPAITAMYKENPGLDQYRKTVLIVETANTVSDMEAAVRKMVRLGIKRLRGAGIGVTMAWSASGGIVPTGNPDHMKISSASKYGKYSLEGLETLEAKTHQSAHGGYDNTYANEDPNRVLPIDMMRKLEKELGVKPHPWYNSTVGNGISGD